MRKGEEHADGVDDRVRRDEQSLVACGEPPLVAGVRKRSLDTPAVSVAAHSSTVVGAVLGPAIPAMRGEQVDAHGSGDRAQRVAVVRLVPDDDLRPETRTPATCVAELFKDWLDVLGFSDRGGRADRGERNAFSANEKLGFLAFPTLRQANSVAPFWRPGRSRRCTSPAG